MYKYVKHRFRNRKTTLQKMQKNNKILKNQNIYYRKKLNKSRKTYSKI